MYTAADFRLEKGTKQDTGRPPAAMEQTLGGTHEIGASYSADNHQTIDPLQALDYNLTKNQISIKKEGSANCLAADRTNVISADPIYGPSTELYEALKSIPTSQQALADEQFPAQTQQIRLFNDPRRHKLFAEYNEIQQQSPDSHLARLGELAHYIFANGRPARIWTAGGEGSAKVGLDPSKLSVHGNCDCRYDEADVLLLTESEHAAWSRASNPPKLVVVRDPAFSQRRPAKTTETWLKEQECIAKSQKVWVDVQRLDRMCDDAAVEKTTLEDAIRQWRDTQNKDKISLETPPMNLLNISDVTPGHWPEGLAKDYQLLFEAIAQCEGMIYKSLDERLAQLPEQERGIGKSTLLVFSHSDIQKCTQFRILAQRGACSSWHMDNVGVYTFTVLEGNLNDPAEKDEDVVKYWPVFPMHHLSSQKQDEALSAFAKQGINWRPTPDGKIPVIALTRGDMLIQPPGTLHAPITLTNCFFLGGMAWRKSTLPQTLKIWYYLMKNEICTNEPLPRQSQVILQYIQLVVHGSPEDFGYQEGALEEFDMMCDEISGMVSRCGCSKACSLSTKCSCLMQGLQCGIRCHKGGALHHTTCTTGRLPSPASLISNSKKKSSNKRQLKDEDSDFALDNTPSARPKSKKRATEAPAHASTSKDVAPQLSANANGHSIIDSIQPKRPEICLKSPTEDACDYRELSRGNLVCIYCSSCVFDEDSRPRRSTTISRPRPAPDTAKHSSSIKALEESHENKCEHCQKTETPLWRSGPNGLHTLCNSCGLKWATEKRKNMPKAVTEVAASTQNNKEKPSEKQQIENDSAKNCEECNEAGDKWRTGSKGPDSLCRNCGQNRDRKVKDASLAMAESYLNDATSEKLTCSECQTTDSPQWHNLRRLNGRGPECRKCYRKSLKKRADDEKRLKRGDSLSRASLAIENEAKVHTGLKIIVRQRPSATPEKSSPGTMHGYGSQHQPLPQQSTDVSPFGFEGQVYSAQTDLSMEDSIVVERPPTPSPKKPLTPFADQSFSQQPRDDCPTALLGMISASYPDFELGNENSMIQNPAPQAYTASSPKEYATLFTNPDNNVRLNSSEVFQPPISGSTTSRSPAAYSDMRCPPSSPSGTTSAQPSSPLTELDDVDFVPDS